MDDMFTIIFGLFILSMGLWMIHLGRKSTGKAKQVKNWPATTAEIINSEVHKRPGANARFRFKIKYRYRVDDREYSNNKIAVGGEITSGRTLAEKWQRQYPEGSSHSLFYNPGDAQESYLEPVVRGGGWLECLGGITAVCLGILLVSGLIG